MERYSGRYPSDATALRRLRGSLRSWLEDVHLDEGELWDVVVAVNEAASNAIDHGRSGGFEVDAAVTDGRVEVVVLDHGAWLPAMGGDDERGRGLSLMRSLAEDVQVTGSPLGTIVRLRFHAHRRIGLPADGPDAPALPPPAPPRPGLVRPRTDNEAMRLTPGYVDGAWTVHLTHTSLVHEALCGAVVDCDGEPDGARICLECAERARAHETALSDVPAPPADPLPVEPLPLAA